MGAHGNTNLERVPTPLMPEHSHTRNAIRCMDQSSQVEEEETKKIALSRLVRLRWKILKWRLRKLYQENDSFLALCANFSLRNSGEVDQSARRTPLKRSTMRVPQALPRLRISKTKASVAPITIFFDAVKNQI